MTNRARFYRRGRFPAEIIAHAVQRVDEALDWIAPPHAEPAYDGLGFEVKVAEATARYSQSV
jgi:hypothetical protein